MKDVRVPDRLRVVSAVAVALLLSGCGVASRACTDMGAYSGISFDFGSVLADTAARGATVKGCVQSACTTRTLQNRRDTQLFIEDNSLDDDNPVPVTLTIETRTGEAVFDGEAEVTPVKEQPNGAGCDPTVHRGRLTATGGDTLTPRDE